MQRHPIAILALALLVLIPQGISGSLYGAGAGEIAAAMGLSADEASWLKTLYLFGHLGALPLAAWTSRRFGDLLLLRVGALSGIVGAIACSVDASPAIQLASWFGHGVSASFLLVFAHRLVLGNLGFRAIALVEGALLLSVVLIPLGIYPYLLALLAERQLWHWTFAIQVLPLTLALYWARFGQWPLASGQKSLRFNGLQALTLSCLIASLTYLLVRGERFNWFDNPAIITLALITLVLAAASVALLRFGLGRSEYLRTRALASRHGKAGMLDATVAGFAIAGTSSLVGLYVTQVMHYSHEQHGELELLGFIGMLGGLLIALFATSHPSRDPEKVIPFGVSLMLVACALLTGRNAGSGAADLWPILMLKGLAVGILNITLTVHILRSFPKPQLTEGIVWFYLFRNLGSLVSIALFSRLMTLETNHSISRLAENFNPTSETFAGIQHQLGQVLAQRLGQSTPEHLGALLQGHLKTQAMAVAGVNNVQWFILAMLALVPIMVIAMRWAHQEPAHD